MRPLVEPFRGQKLGAGTCRPALAFDLDFDPHESLHGRVDRDSAKAERPGKADRPFEQSNVVQGEAKRHRRRPKINPLDKYCLVAKKPPAKEAAIKLSDRPRRGTAASCSCQSRRTISRSMPQAPARPYGRAARPWPHAPTGRGQKKR